jgi:sugar/nucleoside kinase (ribokinase family)
MKEIKPFDVLVVGELNVDLILNNIESMPVMGKEIIADQMTLTLGSSSAIFANNLSILGARVSFLGKIGTDSFSDLVTSSLKTGGVDTSNIIITPHFLTGLTVALNYGNDRAMVTYPGAMNDLKLTDISDKALKSASHMHLSSIFLQQALMPDVVGVFKRAKALGMTTSFDPQWDPQEKWDIDLKELLPFVDIFLPNAGELMQFTAQSSIEAAIDSIKGFCQVVVVKNGVEGAMMWDKSHICVQQAFLNNEVKDAIGAGDSFNSGFIYKFIHKKPLKECLEFAALTGAINTTSSGGTTAFRSFENIKTIAREKFNYTI